MNSFVKLKYGLVILTTLANGILPVILADTSKLFSERVKASAASSSASRYNFWQASLSRFVDNNGLVNYSAWKNNRDELDQFILSLSKISRTEYDTMSREEKIALWINTYNAFTVQVILNHLPLRRSAFNLFPENSIRQIDGVWTKYKVQIAGKRLSLHEIENDILRKEFQEPLIHFAINCGSKSCPPLSNKVYSGKNLNIQLEEAASRFIQSEKFNHIETENRRVLLSKIFQWYGADFVPKYGTKSLSKRSHNENAVISFVAKYSGIKEKKLLESNQFSLTYLNYDWSLNEGTQK